MAVTIETPNGFCIQFEVRETASKGLGVFAAEAVRQGGIVWRHVPGNFTVYDERMFKAEISKLTQAEIRYDLIHMLGLKGIADCVIKIHDAGALINHSSAANTATNGGQPAESALDRLSDHYIRDVAIALLKDQYALVAVRDIELGEELTTDYACECEEPAWFNTIYEQYGIDDSYMNES